LIFQTKTNTGQFSAIAHQEGISNLRETRSWGMMVSISGMQEIITYVYMWIVEFGYKLIKIPCLNDHKFIESLFLRWKI
jgi:hypothetical protein